MCFRLLKLLQGVFPLLSAEPHPHVRTVPCRWYLLDQTGFLYSKSPQGISLAKPVFSADSKVTSATPEQDGVQSKVRACEPLSAAAHYI